MNNLQTVSTSETMTSLELVSMINEIRLVEGKIGNLTPSSLNRTIRNEFDEEISQGSLAQSEYVSTRGRTEPMFELTLDQSKQLLVKESKSVRKAVIRRLNELEAKVVAPKPLSIDQLIEQYQKDKLLITTLSDDVAVEKEVNTVFKSAKGSYTMGETGKVVGMSRNKLFQLLRDNQVLITRGDDHNTPYQRYINNGWFEVKVSNVMDFRGVMRVSRTTYVTAKGLIGIKKSVAKK